MSPLPYIVVVGGSYVGWMAAERLAAEHGKEFRILLIEQNSHFSWLFAFPRFASAAVGCGIEKQIRKGFLPFGPGLFYDYPGTGCMLHARVNHITQGTVRLDREVELDGDTVSEIAYRFLIIATGVKLPLPSIPYGASKEEGVAFLVEHSAQVQRSRKIVLVGAGAVGVQMSLDIKELFPEKEVTLIHSRQQVLNKFHVALHDIIMQRIKDLGVNLVLGSRVKVPNGGFLNDGSVFKVDCSSGMTTESDFVIMSTGQTPRSGLLRSLAPHCIKADGFIAVHDTLQIKDDRLPHIFAIGDVADTGALKAAWVGHEHAIVVSKNIQKILDHDEPEAYTRPTPGIRMSLGLHKGVLFRNPEKEGDEPSIELSEKGEVDLGIDKIWELRHCGDDPDA